MKTRIVLLVLLALAPQASRAESLRWTSINDGRFGTTIDYPANLFTVVFPPGDIWTAPTFGTLDGRAVLSFRGHRRSNVEEPEIQEREAVARSTGKIDYVRATPQFYAYFETENGVIRYRRCNYPPRSAVTDCFYVSYPEATAKWWDPIVTRMSRSLTGHQVDEPRNLVGDQ